MCRPIRRTRIIATLGPASSSFDIVRKLAAAGTDVFRLNFSHGLHEEHMKNAENVRKIDGPMQVDEVMVLAGLAESKSAARRLIEGNGVRVDDNSVLDYRYTVANDAVLSVGKKRFIKVLVRKK